MALFYHFYTAMSQCQYHLDQNNYEHHAKETHADYRLINGILIYHLSYKVYIKFRLLARLSIKGTDYNSIAVIVGEFPTCHPSFGKPWQIAYVLPLKISIPWYSGNFFYTLAIILSINYIGKYGQLAQFEPRLWPVKT